MVKRHIRKSVRRVKRIGLEFNTYMYNICAVKSGNTARAVYIL